VALSIDNARWFTRIRTVGADEERNRIARDLHDRIGQSLAYLAIELDRLTRTHDEGKDVGDAIAQLREDVRSVVREVRETLYDLRTDVSDDQDVSRTLHTYASRVEERSGLILYVRTESEGRLPILQEREMWRIAQEALTNVERHADADNVNLHWSCDGTRALLEVSDDGRGFELDKSGRIDSYGLMGMRERASSIGALLEIDSTPGEGTTIRCSLTPATAGDPRIPDRQQTATGLGPVAN
jgi:signal transduction histidine kinase